MLCFSTGVNYLEDHRYNSYESNKLGRGLYPLPSVFIPMYTGNVHIGRSDTVQIYHPSLYHRESGTSRSTTYIRLDASDLVPFGEWRRSIR